MSAHDHKHGQLLNLYEVCLVSAGIIAFAFGDTILPEVQATVGGNAKKEMYKGISMGYSILLSSYMVVAIAGYWAFGYNVRSTVDRLLFCDACQQCLLLLHA